MVRHTKQGVVHVAWGYDDVLQGYFLSVKDESLESQLEQTSEVKKIVEAVYESGSGYYFQLHTYTFGGFGYKVSQQTMFTFMRRYGIDPGTIHNTPESVESKSSVSAKKKKNKKKKKTSAEAAPTNTEHHQPAERLAAAKTAAVAAMEATESAAASAQAAVEAAVVVAEAATKAANAAKAAAEAFEAAVEVEALEVTEAATDTEGTEAAGVEYWEYEESKEERARTTFLYVPVEGDIQVLPRSTLSTEEILRWPHTECHTLSNLKLIHEPYKLTGFIRSFDFDGPINKRYSKIYGYGTAEIRGPAMIVNENGRQTVSLTEKDIPRIFRQE